MRGLVVAAVMLAANTPLDAAESCASLDSKAVAALFDDWNFALSSLNAEQVVQRYWPNAVLLPTVSNTPRTTAAMIDDYFEHFLAKRPRGRIDTRTIQTGCNMAMDMGTYTFSLMDDKGVTSEVAARYTFVYQYHDGAWKILHHHSSAMPETAPGAMSADAHAEPEKASVASKPAAEPSKPKHKDKEKDVRKTASQAEKPAEKAAEKAAEKKAEQPADPGKPEDRTPLFANLTVSPAPAKFYPPEAAKKKERGNVNLKVCADDAGAIEGTPEIVMSSGSKLLDEAAVTWARAATWVPATLNRQRVEGCTQVFVGFDASV